MQRTTLFLALILSASACASTATPQVDDQATAQPAATNAALQAAIDAPSRDAANRMRDGYRNPLQTLQFFGVQPNQTVIEITPGGGWYTEILAPYLNADGNYIGAVAMAATDSAGGRRNAAFRDKLAGNADTASATLVEFDGKAPVFANGSADVVLTFRNVHNWVGAGNADAYFRGFFAALKPGGVLGVVDHRAKPGTDLETMKSSGYLTEALVTKYATDAGFVLEASSEINANANDGTSHPNGVWTLPPVNRHDAALPQAELIRALSRVSDTPRADRLQQAVWRAVSVHRPPRTRSKTATATHPGRLRPATGGLRGGATGLRQRRSVAADR